MWLCAVLDVSRICALICITVMVEGRSSLEGLLGTHPRVCHVSQFLPSFFTRSSIVSVSLVFLLLLCFRCPLPHQSPSDFFSLPSFLADSACPTLASRISVFSGRHAPPLIVVTGTNINSFVAFHGVFFMSKDSVKCYKCRGAHISEANDKQCTKKHVIAGICDGSPKCLNCHNAGHTA